ncbi:MAG: glycosyltransferase family 39 protein [Burkholderiales bacterium]|nr:glycosyltransferase family 39 protein [Anaerolineae bacterium]
MADARLETRRAALWEMALSLLARPVVIVALITLLAAGLRVYNLGDKSLTLDESKVYWTSQASLTDILTQSNFSFSGPPLYLLLIRVVSDSLNDSEFVLRLVSCIAGILAVPSMYLLARRFTSRDAAYFAALLVAVSLNQVYYSQQLREYSLAFLLSIWIVLLFHEFLRQANWKNAAKLSAVIVLGIASQYGIALLLLSLNLIVAGLWLRPALDDGAARINRPLLLRWIVIQIVGLAVSLLMYVLLLRNQLLPGGVGGGGYLADAYWDGTIRSLLWLIFFQTYQILDFPFVFSSLFLLLFGVGLFSVWRIRPNRVALWLLLLPLLLTFIAALFRLYPYHGHRHTIFLTPMLYVAAALGFEMLTRMKFASALRPAFSALMLGAMFVPALFHTGLYVISEGYENIRPLVDILRRDFDAEGGDRLYVGCAVDEALKYYYPDYQTEWINRIREREGNLALIEQIAADSGRIWLIFAHCGNNDPQVSIERLSMLRPVQLVAQAQGAWLYRADE